MYEHFIPEVATISFCEMYENMQLTRNTRTPHNTTFCFVNSNPQVANACVKYHYMPFF